MALHDAAVHTVEDLARLQELRKRSGAPFVLPFMLGFAEQVWFLHMLIELSWQQ